MAALYEIRADYDRDTIVVYQAYNDAIADAALEAQRFVAPFSTERMTWIKPSFLWLMHRSNWGRKRSQERTLAVRITRAGWDEALGQAVLTSPDGVGFSGGEAWARAYEKAAVHLQWDPERSMRGAALDHYSIQVGLSRQVIQAFVEQWTVAIEDLTPRVRKIRAALDAGKAKQARAWLPKERRLDVDAGLMRRLRPS